LKLKQSNHNGEERREMAKEIVKRTSVMTQASQSIRQARNARMDREVKGDYMDSARLSMFKAGVETMKIDREGNIVEAIDFDQTDDEDEE
jgi:hypothetical protein